MTRVAPFAALLALVVACPGARPPTPDAGPLDAGVDAGPDAGLLDGGVDAGIDAEPDAGLCALAFTPSPDQFGAPCGGFGYNAGLLAVTLGPGRDPDLVFWTVDEDGIRPTVNVLQNHDDGGWLSGLTSYAPFGSNLDGGSIEAVAVGDLDGDGLPDLAVAGELGTCNTCAPLGQVALLLNDGQGGLSAPTLLPWGDQSFTVSFMGPQSLVAADFDGDGRADLASAMLDATVGDQHEDLVVFLSDGGPLQPGGGVHYRLTQSDWALTSLAVADFNGDGRPDLAVAAGNVYLLLNLGGGAFAEPQALLATYGANWIAVADFDGDGTPDLAVLNQMGVGDSDIGLQLFVNDGHGNFSPQPALLLPLGIARTVNYGGQIAAADFTGDGLPDVATFIADQGNLILMVVPGVGDGGLGSPQSFPTSLSGIEGAGSAIVATPLSGGRLPDLAIAAPRDSDYCTKLATLRNECQ